LVRVAWIRASRFCFALAWVCLVRPDAARVVGPQPHGGEEAGAALLDAVGRDEPLLVPPQGGIWVAGQHTLLAPLVQQVGGAPRRVGENQVHDRVRLGGDQALPVARRDHVVGRGDGCVEVDLGLVVAERAERFER